MQSESLIAAHRGALGNPANRFEHIRLDPDADWNPAEDPLPRTQFLRDHSASIIAYNNSPDIGFDASVNPYRGCEHGCVYCYARPTHEFLGFSSGLDFETKIMVKENAAQLLRTELSAKKWQPQIIVMSGNTDCYQPVERKLKITRACLEVLAEFSNPVAIITKNALVTRDVDMLSELARHQAAAVCLSITTLDAELRSVMEPRTSPAAARLEAIRQLTAAGIPVSVNVAPIIPGLNDHEIPAILQAAAAAGATGAGFTMVRLPHANTELFVQWLETHYPNRKDKVLNQLRTMRDGKLYDASWGTRMKGDGIFAEQIQRIFTVARRKAGIKNDQPPLSTAAFRRPGGMQLNLF